LSFLNDLGLTPGQERDKIGCLIETKHKSKEPQHAVTVYDSNIGGSGAQGAAKYFYGAFLGCAPSQNSRALTARFHDLTTKFIDKNDDLDGKQKVRIKNALTVYLRDDQSLAFQAKEFSDRYLPNQPTRSQYATFMEKSDFTSASVVKDLTGIARKLRIRRIHFTSKVKLTAPADEFEKLVKVVDDTDESGFTTIKIAGKIDGQQ
jgi:hypothetical protein